MCFTHTFRNASSICASHLDTHDPASVETEEVEAGLRACKKDEARPVVSDRSQDIRIICHSAC
jgi:hypothetical protein